MNAVDVVRAAAAEVEAGNFAGVAKWIAPGAPFHGTVGGIDEGQVFHGLSCSGTRRLAAVTARSRCTPRPPRCSA